jgi:hypothetical protein
LQRRLLIAGIVITAIGLASLGYLDPSVNNLLFGGTISVDNGGQSLTGTQTFNVNFTNGPIVFPSSSGGTTSLVSVATIIVFVVAVIGLLLTIAGSFAAGGGTPTGTGPPPAVSAHRE